MKKKEVEFVVATGELDDNNNNINIDMIFIKKNTTFIRSVNSSKNIAKCNIFKEDGVLKAKAKLPDWMLDLYPSVSLFVTSTKPNKLGGYEVEDSVLTNIYIHAQENVNPNIKTIREQLNKSETNMEISPNIPIAKL